MRRTLIAGVAALALLLAASVAAVLWPARRDEGPGLSGLPAPAEPAPPPGPLADRAPSAPASPVPPTLRHLPPEVPVEPQRLAKRRPPRGAPAPAELFAGLRSLEARARPCFERGRPAGATGGPLLVLAMESGEGKVTVVDVLVRTRAWATDDAIRCAREQLLGQEIGVSVAHAGYDFEMPVAVRF